MTGPRVAIRTLGCKVNAYDSASIAERLRAAGCRVVAPDEPADVVIVNSCTVTDVADAESRRLARRARRQNAQARVVVTGCWAQTKPAEAAALDAVDKVVGIGRLDDLVAAALAAADATPEVQVGDVRRAAGVDTFGARRFEGQTRAFLKVQEGCDLFCTFCIVPMARGRSRSLPPRAVLDELVGLADGGFEEVVLTGVHLGGYGEDLDPPVDLRWLLEAIVEQGRIPRIRLSSIDPHEVTEDLVRLMRDAPAVCPHLHVPLQAGEDGILRAMRRRYDTVLAAERLEMIRTLLPDAAIGTDLIAGFPGESAEAFDRGLRFLEEAPITYTHVFPYAVRSGTTAAKLPGRVSKSETRTRARCLRRLGSEKARAFRRRFDDTRAEVLVESTRDPQTSALRGYTRNYLRVHLDGPDALMGRRVSARLAARGAVVRGTVTP